MNFYTDKIKAVNTLRKYAPIGAQMIYLTTKNPVLTLDEFKIYLQIMENIFRVRIGVLEQQREAFREEIVWP